MGSITLTAAGWSTEEPYSQAAALAGLTAGSLVALHPTAAQLMALQEAGVTALTAANANGTLTVYALGAAPAADLTLQVTVTVIGSNSRPPGVTFLKKVGKIYLFRARLGSPCGDSATPIGDYKLDPGGSRAGYALQKAPRRRQTTANLA